MGFAKNSKAPYLPHMWAKRVLYPSAADSKVVGFAPLPPIYEEPTEDPLAISPEEELSLLEGTTPRSDLPGRSQRSLLGGEEVSPMDLEEPAPSDPGSEPSFPCEDPPRAA